MADKSTHDDPNHPNAGVHTFNESLAQKLSEYNQATAIGKRTVAGFAKFLAGDNE